MDPNVQNQNTNYQPSPPVAQPTTPPPPVEPPSKAPSKKIIWILLGVAILLIVILAGYLLMRGSGSSNAPEQGAMPEELNKLLVTVGEEEIYMSQLKYAIQEEHGAVPNDKSVHEKMLQIMIERSILDQEAKKLNITVRDDEVNARIGADAEARIKKDVRYTILKEKIMSSQAKSATYHQIGFWVPSFEYPQKPEYEVQRREVSTALTDLMAKLRNGQTPLEVTKYASTQYAELPRLALNGTHYAPDVDPVEMENPRTMVFAEYDPEASASDPALYNALLKAKQGDIMVVDRGDGSSGSVVQVVSVADGEFDTYDDFLTTRKNELVKVHNQI